MTKDSNLIPKLYYIIMFLFGSCNFSINYNHDLDLFKKYTGITQGYKILKHKNLNNQFFIEAKISDTIKVRLEKEHNFNSQETFIEQFNSSKAHKSHVPFNIHAEKIYKKSMKYYLNDNIGNFYAYYFIVLNKQSNTLFFCLEYGD